MQAPQLFDRTVIAARRQRALRQTTPGADFLLVEATRDLADRLSSVQRHFGIAVALGGATSHLVDVLATSNRIGTIVRADSVWAEPERPPSPSQVEPRRGTPDVVLQEDAFPFASGSIDLIVSALTLHTIDDLPGTLIQIRRALKPDGLFLAALPGGDTLAELRDALSAAEIELTGGVSPRVIPLLDVRDLGGLLQRAGFALPVTDSERLTVRYDSMLGLIRDLRAMGATNPLYERSRKPTSRALFLRAAEIYAERSCRRAAGDHQTVNRSRRGVDLPPIASPMRLEPESNRRGTLSVNGKSMAQLRIDDVGHIEPLVGQARSEHGRPANDCNRYQCRDQGILDRRGAPCIGQHPTGREFDPAREHFCSPMRNHWRFLDTQTRSIRYGTRGSSAGGIG